ncbi:Lysine demethylase 2 [Carabus blaptoides fortunei]
MVQCDHCKDWYHGNCVDVKEYSAIELDKYHCPRCVPVVGSSILKPYRNCHRHDFWDPDAYDKPVQTGTGVFIRELCKRHFSSEGEIVLHMRGQQLTENFLHQNGFNNPIVIDGKDGLDMTIPPENFSLYDVESYIGGEREIDVIDVMRQCDFKMSLRDFVEYFNSPNRTRIFNCVSLEFSGTGLSRLVDAPLIARRLDWVNTVWPRDLPEDTHMKPRVQKYCLMSVKDSYTDFHVDFGGTSVWYHVLRGEKIFYFIHPTSANLTLYQQWMTSSTQNETFFGDQVDQCYKCVLRQGQTMLIPTGWIHAVLTTADSLVFGGNFLHSLNIPMQLQVYDIEKKINTAERFKFPAFEAVNWYAAKKIMHQLKELNSEDKKCPNYILTGVKALLAVLKQWNTDKDYNMSNREQIPDVINSHKLLKDLGKELRQAERYLMSLNPPKPERESKRKRKRPVNKDFVDFSQPQKIYDMLESVVSKTRGDNQNNKRQDANLKELHGSPNSKKSASPKTPVLVHSKIGTPRSACSTPGSTSSGSGLLSLPSSQTSVSTDSSERKWINDYPVDPNERWIVTNVSTGRSDRPGILKFKCSSKDVQNETIDSLDTSIQSLDLELISGSGESKVFDFSEDTDHRDDEFALKIDENPKKKRMVGKVRLPGSIHAKTDQQHFLIPDVDLDVSAESPKNGIESLLKASALTNKFIDSGRASPSTREAIAGMLSIGQTYSMPMGSFTSPQSKTIRRRRSTPPKDHFEENIRNVHQDDEYIYPSLDNSDEEDYQIFKPRGRSKVDEAWNPKARVGPLLPKMNRPAREGTKRQAVEKVLEAAAAKRASEPTIQEIHQKRAYRKKKIKPPQKQAPKEIKDTSFGSTLTSPVGQSATSPASSKQKKGMKTAKQRLGKILKIHKMIH